MKKRFFIFLLTSLLLLCCVSCNQKQPPESPPNAVEQSQEQTTAETPEESEGETPDTETPQDTKDPSGEDETPKTPSATGTEGLLTAEEITTLEGLYEKTLEETLTALSLTAEDASMQDEVSITFTGVRTIAGLSFNQTLNNSADTGFYGTDYRIGIPSDTEQLAETVQQIYDDAVAFYGEPNTYPGMGNSLSEQLEKGEIAGMETWAAGEGTTLTMQVDDMGDLVILSLSYRMTVSYN